MTKKDFIANIIDDVTVGGMLPFNVPMPRVMRMVDDSLSTFREKDDRATIEDILFINTKELGDCKVIILPDDVKAVTRLEHTSSSLGSRDALGLIDETTIRHTTGDNDMLSYVTKEAYYQLARVMGVRFMPYDFSEYTHELILEGDINGNLFAEVHKFIPAEAVYSIDSFKNFCGAMLTLDWCKANMFLKAKLVQGREIDWASMKEDANATIEAMQEDWDDQANNAVMMLD